MNVLEQALNRGKVKIKKETKFEQLENDIRIAIDKYQYINISKEEAKTISNKVINEIFNN